MSEEVNKGRRSIRFFAILLAIVIIGGSAMYYVTRDTWINDKRCARVILGLISQ